MPIKITRIETLALMQELPANHFLQSRLVEELVELNKSASARFGSPEVHNGTLVVTPTKVLGIKSDYDGSMGQHTQEQLDTLDEVSGGVKKQCKWETYGYQCRETSKNEFCDEHRNVKCTHLNEHGILCFNMANHGCPTELQFVCGAPVCAEHSNCGRHYRRSLT